MTNKQRRIRTKVFDNVLFYLRYNRVRSIIRNFLIAYDILRIGSAFTQYVIRNTIASGQFLFRKSLHLMIFRREQLCQSSR
jgi:hypothetical protein